MQKTTLGFNLYEKDDKFNITGEEGSLNETIKKINQEIEGTKKSVSDGKSLVASAITEKGVETATDATFQTMHDNILNIKSGGTGSYVIADNSLDNTPLVSKDIFKTADSIIGCSVYLEEVN